MVIGNGADRMGCSISFQKGLWREFSFLRALMARIYKRKADAKRERVTVPVSTALMSRLQAYSERIGVTKTTAARLLIEAGLKRGAKN